MGRKVISRWDGFRDSQSYLYGKKKRYFNIKKGKSKIWNRLRDKEMITYAMKPDIHEVGMDENTFLVVVNGIITSLNLNIS